MLVARDLVVHVLRGRGDEDAAVRAQDELPEHFDPDDHTEVLLAYGVDLQDLDDQETLEATPGSSATDDTLDPDSLLGR